MVKLCLRFSLLVKNCNCLNKCLTIISFMDGVRKWGGGLYLPFIFVKCHKKWFVDIRKFVFAVLICYICRKILSLQIRKFYINFRFQISYYVG